MPLKNRGVECVASALTTFLSTASSRGFDCIIVKTDGEGAIASMATVLNGKGIVIDTAGPGQHVPVVERKIQTLKQRVRSYENSLPFVMTKLLLIMCVTQRAHTSTHCGHRKYYRHNYEIDTAAENLLEFAGGTKASHGTDEIALTMSVKTALRDRKEEATSVMKAELTQMNTKKVWHGVKSKNLTVPQRRAIIRSSMFLKDKYLASGTFDKFKAQLVAGGNQQDKSLHENLSSPTAALTSVFTVAAIAAQEKRH